MSINKKTNCRVLAVVVTYFPDKDLLKKNVSSFFNYVDKILVWENTPIEKAKEFRCLSNAKIEYCGDGNNSISHALNYAWHYAADNDYDYLLTMDQDSVWDDIGVYFSTTIFNSMAPYGVYGPTIDDSLNDRSYQDEFHCHDIITSGMLIPVKILNHVGGYNEEFKIDGIDAYFCYSAMNLGYKVYTVKGCILRQQFGNYGFTSFLNHKFTTYNYSASRLFEIYKSQIIIMRRFHVTSEYKRNFWKNRILKWPIKIMLGEQDKLAKMMAICRGTVAGLNYRVR